MIQINAHIRYSGTPMTYSFGKEESQEKSVTIIDVMDDGSMEQRVIPVPQLHKRVTLTGTFDELMQADYDEAAVNGYVRLDVTDSYVGRYQI